MKVWEALVYRGSSGSTGFRKSCRRRFREVLVQIQVRFNRVPMKNPVWEALVQSQVKFNGFRRGCGKGCFGNLWYRAGSAIGSAEGFQRLASQYASEKIVKKNVATVGNTTEIYHYF